MVVYDSTSSVVRKRGNKCFLAADKKMFTFEVNSALDCLNKNLQHAIDQLAPLKTINPGKTKQPWINNDLRLLINKIKATERRY